MILSRLYLSVLLIASFIFMPVTIRSQEQNVRPGINQSYQTPDFQKWRAVFESPGREVFDRRHAILDVLQLKSGMKIADIGAGTGLFTQLFAQSVGPEGQVYAVDISRNFVENIERRARDNDLSNVQGVVNNAKSVNLPPESINLAFVCDTYHHFEYPLTTLQSIHNALRPGGTLVIIDFRRIPGFSSKWVMNHVRTDKQAVIEEIESKGFQMVEDNSLLQTNYFLRFLKM
ncbi:MAG: methyltransferase domain-containing protein [Gammaproteobacteria bacterium]|nr:methyltransferase domain-containing protein [Gammaproteobacteria bacterium]